MRSRHRAVADAGGNVRQVTHGTRPYTAGRRPAAVVASARHSYPSVRHAVRGEAGGSPRERCVAPSHRQHKPPRPLLALPTTLHIQYMKTFEHINDHAIP